ncbi:RrF2 family transcriptional regulator [Mesorhizobium sp. A623]
MRLAAFTDYGLRVLMRLADKPDAVLTTSGIAKELHIPYSHLAKVVQDLAKGGYILTQRGAGGGIRLARPAAAITLGEVVRCLEHRHAVVECFRADGGACLLTPSCRFKSKLSAAQAAFISELDKTSLAECALPAPQACERREL